MITKHRKLLGEVAGHVDSNPRCAGKCLGKSPKATRACFGTALAGACCLLFAAPLPAQINESMLPTWAQQTWAPGIPGGIPLDNDSLRPASVWLPSGNPYSGYSVNPDR